MFSVQNTWARWQGHSVHSLVSHRGTHRPQSSSLSTVIRGIDSESQTAPELFQGSNHLACACCTSASKLWRLIFQVSISSLYIFGKQKYTKGWQMKGKSNIKLVFSGNASKLFAKVLEYRLKGYFFLKVIPTFSVLSMLLKLYQNVLLMSSLIKLFSDPPHG